MPTPLPSEAQEQLENEAESHIFIEPVKEAKRTLTLDQPKHRKWWHNATIYQIWVRSFYDSNDDGHGDLAGITAKLDYIAQLGVDAIWLSPIFESPSYHGYDTSDFYAIERDFGTMADFETLVTEAKARNIKVVLDLVLNHVSNQHPWFVKSAANDPAYRDYFVWQDSRPENWGSAWEHEVDPALVWHPSGEHFYYSVFSASQPDLNFDHPKVREEIEGVTQFWLNKGIDGFRLDAIRYLFEDGGMEGQADTERNIEYFTTFNARVKNINPNAMLVGEALTDTDTIGRYFQNGKGIDSAFDFGFGYLMESIFTETDTAIANRAEKAESIRDSLWQYIEARTLNRDVPDYFYASFLQNHDTDRLIAHWNNDINRARIAAGLLLTYPSTQYIYYGEEVGMNQAQVRGDDMYRRGLMQWSQADNAGFNTSGKRWLDNPAWFPWLDSFSPWWETYWKNTANDSSHVSAQITEENSLLSLYRSLISLRQTHSALRQPTSIHLYRDTGMAWVVNYVENNQSLWVILNLDPDMTTTFSLPTEISGEYVDLLTGKGVPTNKELQLASGQLLVLQKTKR